MMKKRTKIDIVRICDEGCYRGCIAKVDDQSDHGKWNVTVRIAEGQFVELLVKNVEHKYLDQQAPVVDYQSELEERIQWLTTHGRWVTHCNKCGMPNLDL